MNRPNDSKKHIPKYYVYRMIFVAGIIYMMLVLPFSALVRFSQFSDLLSFSETDEIVENVLEDHKIELHAGESDTKNLIQQKFRYERPDIFARKLHNWLFPLSLLAYIIFNRGFKRYFRLLRKGKPVPEHIGRFVRKYFVKMPVLNVVVAFSLPLIVQIIGIFEIVNKPDFHTNPNLLAEKQLLFINVIATLLTGFFVYYWQKNRQQFLYLEHVFPPEELREPLKSKFQSHIGKYFLAVNLLTIAFPVVVIIFYLSMSITSFAELGITELTDGQKQLLFNDFLSFRKFLEQPDIFPYGMFINVDNTYILIWGLTESFFSVIIYLIFFIKWSTRLVVKPVNHLLKNMQITGEGNMTNFAVVRSNDEIGQLAAEYNKMSARLKTYFDEVTDLNKNLEQKVIDRTKQINEQKEEIEAQRDALIDKNNEIESQNEEIIQQRDKLQHQQKEITDSINYAKRIQDAVLPTADLLPPDRMFILFKPRDIVSGDFYYQSDLGRKKVIAAADCTGHGVPGAFMSMLGISFLNEIFKHEFDSAADVLNRLRDEVKAALKQTEKDATQKDGMDIALCIIDEENNRLEYAGAYNPLYLIRNGELLEIKATRNPIGVYIKEIPFENHIVNLQKGDTVYLFSDGYADQLGGKNGEKFKIKRFKQLLKSNAHKKIDEQYQAYIQRFDNWRGDNDQLDDVLLIGLKF